MSNFLLQSLLALAGNTTYLERPRKTMPMRKGDLYTYNVNGRSIEAVSLKQAEKKYKKLFK